MNKGLYSIAGLLAVSALKKLGSSNRSISSGTSIAEFISNSKNVSNIRPDAFLATVYSFIDLDEPFDESLSAITNTDTPVDILYQPIFMMKFMINDSERSRIASSIEQAIVDSFDGDIEKANICFQKNFHSLYTAYSQYFSSCDQGVQYDYIQNRVYPDIVNDDLWLKFFKGSEKPIFGKQIDIKENKESMDIFYSTLFSNNVNKKTASRQLEGDLSINNLFDNASAILKALHVSSVKSTPIGQLPNYRIYESLNSDPISQMTGYADYISNFIMVDLVLKSIDSMAKNLPLQVRTYEDFYNFLNCVTRSPSDTMVLYQMDMYRKNNTIKDLLPKSYIEQNGKIESLWREKGTPSWSSVTWMLYYLYSNFEKTVVDTTVDWKFGMKFSCRLSRVLIEGFTFNSPEILKKTIYNTLGMFMSKETSKMIDNIIKGTGSFSDFPSMGFNPSDPETRNLIAESFSDEIYNDGNITIYYDPDSDRSLNYMARYMSHCDTVRPGSEIYAVFLRDVPYYTVEVLSDGGMMQFKGYKNRAVGSEKSYSNTSRQNPGLFIDDTKNFSRVFNEIRRHRKGDLYLTDTILNTDLKLMKQSSDINQVKPQLTLRDHIHDAVVRL